MRPRSEGREVLLRRARPRDAAAIEAVRVGTWKVAYRGILPDALLDAKEPRSGPALERLRDWIREPLEESVEAPSGKGIWVASRGEEVLGFVHHGPSRDRDAPGAGEVYALYVQPGAWDLGLGRRLMERALTDLAAAGLEPVTLWVLRENQRARRFYRAGGFCPDGASKQVESGGAVLDEIRMRRDPEGAPAREPE